MREVIEAKERTSRERRKIAGLSNRLLEFVNQLESA